MIPVLWLLEESCVFAVLCSLLQSVELASFCISAIWRDSASSFPRCCSSISLYLASLPVRVNTFQNLLLCMLPTLLGLAFALFQDPDIE